MSLSGIGCNLLLALFVTGAEFTGAEEPDAAFGVALACLVVAVAAIVLASMFAVQRLHDLNHPGWLSLLLVIPVIDLLMGLYLLFARGTAGANDCGLAPPPNRIGVTLAGLLRWLPSSASSPPSRCRRIRSTRRGRSKRSSFGSTPNRPAAARLCLGSARQRQPAAAPPGGRSFLRCEIEDPLGHRPNVFGRHPSIRDERHDTAVAAAAVHDLARRHAHATIVIYITRGESLPSVNRRLLTRVLGIEFQQHAQGGRT